MFQMRLFEAIHFIFCYRNSMSIGNKERKYILFVPRAYWGKMQSNMSHGIRSKIFRDILYIIGSMG